MREKGLVRSTEHPDGSTEEWAFTDSAFFFDRAVAKKLLGFWEKDLGGNLACEVDCYGDFLQPLGPEADASYLGSTAALVAGAGDTSDLVAIRQGLWELLSGTALTVLPLTRRASTTSGPSWSTCTSSRRTRRSRRRS